MPIRETLRHALQAVTKRTTRFGWEPTRMKLAFGESRDWDLTEILHQGDWVVDIGANEGQTLDAIFRAQPETLVWAFEPNPRSFQSLAARFVDDDRVNLFQSAVGVEGPVTLYMTEESEGSSLLAPVSGRSETWLSVEDSVEVNSVTLEAILQTRPQDRRCGLLKVDTQGFDLAVLRSGKELLTPDVINAVMMEICFDHYYENQDTPGDSLTFMLDHGFSPAAVYTPTRVRPPGPLGWIDILFLERQLTNSRL